MRKRLLWKVILTALVIGVAIFISLPLGEKIHYGLDLKGGIHLLMQVVTDDAISAETDQGIARLQEQLKKKNLSFTSITKAEPGRFTLSGVVPDQERQVKDVLDEFFKDWTYTLLADKAQLTLKIQVAQYLREQAVNQAVETIRNRVDQFGVAEPIIQRQGNERMVIELPGVDNLERVMSIIKTTAMLEWKLVKAGPAPDEETLLKDSGGKVPDDADALKADPKRGSSGWFLVSKVATVTGSDIRSVHRSVDEWNNPAVAFTLNSDGGKRFEQATGENIGKLMAIVLDGKIQSHPVIQTKIPAATGGIIQGTFSLEEAEDLVLVLKSGALPATIKTLENRTIGPSLGADSIRAGFLASIVALLLVVSFMLVFYRFSGLNAVIALVLNILLVIGALAYFKANLTLPGIAGIILSIGMSVDANVLVFERIKEELALGKSIPSSIALGFKRAFSAIFDSNLTTIISAVFLFQFGTGPIKGYAITLIIGLTANMFTAVFVSHLIFDLTVTNRKRIQKLSI